MRKSFLFTAACFLFTLALQAQRLNFRVLTPQQGLSHSTVYAIAQDEQGYMWFGTREGLNRFDSRQVRNYYMNTPVNGESSNEVRALLPFKNHLYLGTNNGLFIYDPVLDTITMLKTGAVNIGAVHSLYQSNNDIFICSVKGLFKLRKNNQLQILISNQGATAMCEFKKNVFFITLGNKLRVINDEGEKINDFTSAALPALANPNFLIHTLYRDSAGDMWVGSNMGLYVYETQTGKFKQITISPLYESNTIRTITEGSHNKIWAGTEAGLFIYDKLTGHTDFYTQSFNRASGYLSDKAIYSSFTGKNGIVWLGTYFGGVNYAFIQEKGFHKLMPGDTNGELSGKAVSQIIQDEKGILWIGTEDGGITLFDRKHNTFSYLKHQEGNTNSLNINNVHAICDDHLGNVWIGTFLGGLNRYNLKTRNFSAYVNNYHDQHSLSNDYVYAVYKDSKQVLWVGTQQGLNIYDYKNNNFNAFLPQIFGKLFIYDILEDRQNQLWFCTRDSGIFRYSRIDHKLIHYGTASAGKGKLSSNKIVSVYQDSKSRLWFGTLDGGLIQWDPEKQAFKNRTTREGLPNNSVYGILEDSTHMIWFTTNKGLSKLNPTTGELINYNNQYGLPSNQFNLKSFFKDDAGYMYFGTINGLCYFNEQSVNAIQTASPIHFTAFKLFNKEVKPGTDDVLAKQIDQTQKIKLPYDKNEITIDFVALNFSSSGSSNFEYFLEGFDKSWNNAGNKQSVTYTNLPPGKYTFHVTNTYLKKNIPQSERTLLITINPPFYLTTWACAFYILAFLAAIYLYTRFIRFIHQQKLAVQLERVEKEKMSEINQHRLNFFLFISHEFKTPLTLIIASIEKLVNEFSDIIKKNPDLYLLKNNASRLYLLIEQLMEFRKIETDHVRLELRKADILMYLSETLNAFVPLYRNKHIDHHYALNIGSLQCYFDADKLEKIILNILSNAVKNTDKGGLIDVAADIYDDPDNTNQKTLHLKIADSGRGMTSEELEKAFHLFFIGAESRKNNNGTGIGLALVNSLINLLQGTITIDSKINEGTVINIKLPLYTALNKDQEKFLVVDILQKRPISELIFAGDLHMKNEVMKEHTTPFTLFIVEDNKELLNFLASHFSKQYKIITALSGVAALKKIRKNLPDIIISDIKMPKMDGITMCKVLKADPQLSHIPVILLAESSHEDSKIESLGAGAETYMPKPFHLKELELQLTNMINSRIILKNQLDGQKDGVTNLPRNNKDQEFLNKLSVFIDLNYTNPKLSIEDMAKETGMSRSLLHIKLKKLLNLSATEFLNEYRIKKAKFMLENDLPVAEVAYFSGYADPNYFSRVFKKAVNMSPSAYKDSITKQETQDMLI